MVMRVDLDQAATTPLRAEVRAALFDALDAGWGNPSAAHADGRRARAALDETIERVAGVFGVRSEDVVLTSGGTEADDLAIRGLAGVSGVASPLALCSAAEHHAVLRTVETLGGVVVAVEPSTGTIDLDHLERELNSIGARAALVSVMAANNETGAISDLAAVRGVLHRAAPACVLHTDAVQAPRWIELDPGGPIGTADAISVSGHKIGAPVGIGALVLRRVRPRATMPGGGQQDGRRGGTENAALGAAFATALDLAVGERMHVVAGTARRRDRLVAGIVDGLGGRCVLTLAGGAHVLPGHAHLRFGSGVESEALLALLDRAGIAASAGSACASGAMEPSHVLLAMGVAPDEALSSLRLTLGPTTTDDDIEAAINAVVTAVLRLRGWRP